MNITESNIIGELVAEDYRTAPVFKAYGIDFCCKGNRSIRDACERQEADMEALLRNLNRVVQEQNGHAPDYRTWPLDLLVDYITKKHHRYVASRIEEIMPFLSKVVRVHGGSHPELPEVGELFAASAMELSAHMQKEEHILFPFIKNLEMARQNRTEISRPHFGTVGNPIEMMKHEHTAEGDRFRRISELTAGYNPPEDACNTYRVTYALLREFEADLHEHIHLENNILFPKAMELEKELCN